MMHQKKTENTITPKTIQYVTVLLFSLVAFTLLALSFSAFPVFNLVQRSLSTFRTLPQYLQEFLNVEGTQIFLDGRILR